MKPCVKCGSADRYASGPCRPCGQRISKLAYARNKNKIIARAKVWKADNKEKVKLGNAVYGATHRTQESAKMRRWREANPDRSKASVAQWQSKNTEKLYANNAKRRASKLMAVPPWFGENDELILKEAFDLAKRRSKLTGVKHHVDHIVPLQSQYVCGLHIGRNVQVIPAAQNISKHNRHWPDMPTVER